jgi:hypothetical protein
MWVYQGVVNVTTRLITGEAEMRELNFCRTKNHHSCKAVGGGTSCIHKSI